MRYSCLLRRLWVARLHLKHLQVILGESLVRFKTWPLSLPTGEREKPLSDSPMTPGGHPRLGGRRPMGRDTHPLPMLLSRVYSV
jgi:hypothetical protein